MAGPPGPATMEDIKMIAILLSRNCIEGALTTNERQRGDFYERIVAASAPNFSLKGEVF
jgi:hypothetical protein